METDKAAIPPDAQVKPDVFLLKNSFQNHGNEIEEIISNKPPMFVRWGTLYFFFILAGLSLISWFIKYPDIVVAKARLISVNAAKEVITRTEGKLIKIAVNEKDKVEAGQILGYMESIANPASIESICNRIDSINQLIIQHHTDEIIGLFPDYSNLKINDNLGELQAPYQIFIQSFITFRDFLSSGFFLRKKKMLRIDLQNIQKLNTILVAQKVLLDQDIALSNESYKASQSLANDKVISSLDYRNEKSKLISKQLSTPQINTSIVSNESLQNEKLKEIAELENQIIVQKNTFVQSLQTIKSQVQSWQFKYLLRSPIAGTVFFTGFFQENQDMKLGQTLFYVQPQNTSYFVEILIPQYNFGKIKIDQKVQLKFQAYPFEQYGAVVGKIDYINATPSDSGYLAKVSLPNGLVTNYKKNLIYHNGLLAQADIIIENMRLPERFYYNLIKQIKR